MLLCRKASQSHCHQIPLSQSLVGTWTPCVPFWASNTLCCVCGCSGVGNVGTIYWTHQPSTLDPPPRNTQLLLVHVRLDNPFHLQWSVAPSALKALQTAGVSLRPLPAPPTAHRIQEAPPTAYLIQEDLVAVQARSALSTPCSWGTRDKCICIEGWIWYWTQTLHLGEVGTTNGAARV